MNDCSKLYPVGSTRWEQVWYQSSSSSQPHPLLLWSFNSSFGPIGNRYLLWSCVPNAPMKSKAPSRSEGPMISILDPRAFRIRKRAWGWGHSNQNNMADRLELICGRKAVLFHLMLACSPDQRNCRGTIMPTAVTWWGLKCWGRLKKTTQAEEMICPNEDGKVHFV